MSITHFVGRSVARLSGGALSLNSFETAWTFPKPFHKMNIDSLRMIYVNFYRPIYDRFIKDHLWTRYLLGDVPWSMPNFLSPLPLPWGVGLGTL